MAVELNIEWIYCIQNGLNSRTIYFEERIKINTYKDCNFQVRTQKTQGYSMKYKSKRGKEFGE